MKKNLIVTLLVYLLLFVGFNYNSTYAFAAIGALLLVPVTLTLLIINIRRDNNKVSFDNILVLCFGLGISILIVIGRTKILHDYYIIGFLLLTIFLSLVVGLVLNKLSSKTSATLILPLIAIFSIEAYQSDDFVTIDNIYRLDRLAFEVKQTNIQLANSIRVNGNQIKYSETLTLLNNYFEEVVAYTGGYRDMSPMLGTLMAPNSKVPSELDPYIFEIRKSLDKDISEESNESNRNTLLYIKNEMFNQNSLDNTVLEMRLRIYSAQSQLLALNKKE